MRTAAMPCRRLPTAYFLVLALACVTLAGCGATDKKAHSGKREFGLTQPDKASETAAAVELRTVSQEGFEKAVASHKGKVVLVDFWATWCGPCVTQFPHTVELAKKYKDQGLIVISVSVDEPEEIEAVHKFLKEKGADFDNLITEYGLNAIEKFDVDNGGVPCYWIYDRDGKLAERISPGDPTKKFTPQQIDDAVERLLGLTATGGDPPESEDAAKPAQESQSSEQTKPAL